MLRLKAMSQKVLCYKVSQEWLDLGRFEDFERAQEIVADPRKKFLRGIR
jgi:NDP-sugar pyrophosphorylase family protein